MLNNEPPRRLRARKRISRHWSTADRWTPPRASRKDVLDIVVFASVSIIVLVLACVAIIDARTLQDWLQ